MKTSNEEPIQARRIDWWTAEANQGPDGDEFHTAWVWGQIAKAAIDAGDWRRAKEAMRAAMRDSD